MVFLLLFKNIQNSVSVGWSPILKSLWTCNWCENLKSNHFNEILAQNFADIDLSTQNNEELLGLAISALQAFVQQNFVGPLLNDDDADTELPWHSAVECIGDESIRNYLISDGEAINVNANLPELLAVAKYIFLHLHSKLDAISDSVERFVCQQWILRYYGVHQLIIDQHVDTLFNGINKISDSLVNDLQTLDSIDQDTKVICALEITAWQLNYKRISVAKEKLKMAQQMLDVNITIEGKMGVRTKYQQKPLPQLMLRLDSPNGDVAVDVPSIESPIAPIKLPALLQLDDDTRLDKIQFVNEEDNVITKTKSIVQAFILATL